MYISIYLMSQHDSNTSSDPRNCSNNPPGRAGRDKFQEPSSPFLPLPIVAWRDALKKVIVNPKRDPSLNKNDGGYVFPSPGLFFGVGTPEVQAKFFYNWLKYRPALIYRLTAQNLNPRPLSSQFWRSMLHLPIDGQIPPRRASTLPSPLSLPTRPPSISHTTVPSDLQNTSGQQDQTKSAKRLEVIQALLQDCLNVDGLQINHTPTNDIFWQEQQLSPGALPVQKVAQEILWELSELNFRCEFMALDLRAHAPTATGAMPTNVPREDLLLQCFPGNITGSILVVQRDFAHQGLAASNWKDRAPFILAFLNVVRTWSGFDKVLQSCTDVDLTVTQDVEAYSRGAIDAAENAIAGFYTQSFYDFFGRAAIIPRRLEHEPIEPAIEPA